MNKRARLSKADTVPKFTPQNQFVYPIYSKPRNEMTRRGLPPNNPINPPKRYAIEIIMSIPNADEECPLTLDPIAVSKLSFLPDTPFIMDRPNHTKLTLPCKHSFSAMTLLYSFCKNGMVCPCCRAGEDIQADTQCLPSHFRALFKTRIQDTLETERRQDESSEYQDILDSFSMFGVTLPYEMLGANGNLSLVANFYDIQNETGPQRPIFSFSNVVEPRRDGGRVTLTPRGPLRALTHVCHMGVNSIQLSIMLSMQGMGDVVIDSTTIIRLPDVSDLNAPTRLNIPGAANNAVTQNGQFQVLLQLNESNNPITSFAVLFSRMGAFFVLDNITWCPGTENLEIISTNVSLDAVL
jgi:hypothetical protein